MHLQYCAGLHRVAPLRVLLLLPHSQDRSPRVSFNYARPFHVLRHNLDPSPSFQLGLFRVLFKWNRGKRRDTKHLVFVSIILELLDLDRRSCAYLCEPQVLNCCPESESIHEGRYWPSSVKNDKLRFCGSDLPDRPCSNREHLVGNRLGVRGTSFRCFYCLLLRSFSATWLRCARHPSLRTFHVSENLTGGSLTTTG